ncbi:hypothetical protein QTP88_013040 [Uroleucon formosanum]
MIACCNLIGSNEIVLPFYVVCLLLVYISLRLHLRNSSYLQCSQLISIIYCIAVELFLTEYSGCTFGYNMPQTNDGAQYNIAILPTSTFCVGFGKHHSSENFRVGGNRFIERMNVEVINVDGGLLLLMHTFDLIVLKLFNYRAPCDLGGYFNIVTNTSLECILNYKY